MSRLSSIYPSLLQTNHIREERSVVTGWSCFQKHACGSDLPALTNARQHALRGMT